MCEKSCLTTSSRPVRPSALSVELAPVSPSHPFPQLPGSRFIPPGARLLPGVQHRIQPPSCLPVHGLVWCNVLCVSERAVIHPFVAQNITPEAAFVGMSRASCFTLGRCDACGTHLSPSGCHACRHRSASMPGPAAQDAAAGLFAAAWPLFNILLFAFCSPPISLHLATVFGRPGGPAVYALAVMHATTCLHSCLVRATPDAPLA